MSNKVDGLNKYSKENLRVSREVVLNSIEKEMKKRELEEKESRKIFKKVDGIFHHKKEDIIPEDVSAENLASPKITNENEIKRDKVEKIISFPPKLSEPIRKIEIKKEEIKVDKNKQKIWLSEMGNIISETNNNEIDNIEISRQKNRKLQEENEEKIKFIENQKIQKEETRLKEKEEKEKFLELQKFKKEEELRMREEERIKTKEEKVLHELELKKLKESEKKIIEEVKRTKIEEKRQQQLKDQEEKELHEIELKRAKEELLRKKEQEKIILEEEKLEHQKEIIAKKEKLRQEKILLKQTKILAKKKAKEAKRIAKIKEAEEKKTMRLLSAQDREKEKLHRIEEEKRLKTELKIKKEKEKIEENENKLKLIAEKKIFKAEQRIINKKRRKKIAKKIIANIKHFSLSLNNNLIIALKKIIIASILILVCAISFYILLVFLITKLKLDNPILRNLSNVFPVPALFNKTSMIEYYQYQDTKISEFLKNDVNKDDVEKNLKLVFANEMIISDLAKKYQIKDTDKIERDKKIEISAVQDKDINQVPINRILKIKDLIKSGESFKDAAKYGDEQGIVIINEANINLFNFGEKVKNLEANTLSEIITTPEGYYIFNPLKISPDEMELSYVLVRSNDLKSYIEQQVPNYKMWSLVD